MVFATANLRSEGWRQNQMLTLDDLAEATINPQVAREAMAQVEKRLADALETKASHEQKAFALLAAYITLALALFTVFGVLATKDDRLAQPFLASGFAYALGAVSCGVALWPRTYGVRGSDPSAWLRPGIIDGDEHALDAGLAYEIYFHEERIQSSARANRCKVWFIRAAIFVGVGTPIGLPFWIWMQS
jgi:hypothetical protein